MRYLVVIFICFIVSCSSTRIEKRKEEVRAFEKHIKDSYKDDSIELLERLTKSICPVDRSCFGGSIKQPSNYNIRAWQEWLDLNKSKLSIVGDSIYLTEPAEMPVKDPLVVLNQYINHIESMNQNLSYHIDDVDFIIDQFEIASNHKIEYSSWYDDKIAGMNTGPAKTWLKENEEFLIWDKENQVVVVRKSDKETLRKSIFKEVDWILNKVGDKSQFNRNFIITKFKVENENYIGISTESKRIYNSYNNLNFKYQWASGLKIKVIIRKQVI
ncbi:hypothetical protein JCM19297_790 [Nonlabens ulvanivorans]|nr:hypothetical protein JCM19297_790 [Nonlabens ulvanivorans]